MWAGLCILHKYRYIYLQNMLAIWSSRDFYDYEGHYSGLLACDIVCFGSWWYAGSVLSPNVILHVPDCTVS